MQHIGALCLTTLDQPTGLVDAAAGLQQIVLLVVRVSATVKMTFVLVTVVLVVVAYQKVVLTQPKAMAAVRCL
jgi:predicted ABC-type transport system involved in lysophospholipase L1 biosynthesis ATPase subunit